MDDFDEIYSNIDSTNIGAANKTGTGKIVLQTSPTFAGTIIGTYTLAGTPTITSPTISGPTFSGSVIGTYTLAGTPTLSVTVAGTPTFSGIVSFSSDVNIAATKKLYLDGGGDTYIYESSANVARFVAGGLNALSISSTIVQVNTGDFSVEPTKLMYLDGGGDTYFHETSANILNAVVGGGVAFSTTTALFSFGGAKDVALTATKLLYLDGGIDTYINESSANVLDLVAGGVNAIKCTSGAVSLPNLGTSNAANLQTGAAGLLTYPVSSLKYKKDVVDLTTDSLKIYDLRPVDFKYKSDNSSDIGFIAEEVEQVLPVLVYHKDGEPESVHYEKLVVLLLAEMKKLKSRLDVSGL